MSRTDGGAYQSGDRPVEDLKPPPKGPGLGAPKPAHSAEVACRLAPLALALVLLAGCHQSDDDRLDRKTVKGVECIVVRDGIGKAQAIDCDWGQR